MGSPSMGNRIMFTGLALGSSPRASGEQLNAIPVVDCRFVGWLDAHSGKAVDNQENVIRLWFHVRGEGKGIV